jgi:putative drug exporter of the RND superfamily
LVAKLGAVCARYRWVVIVLWIILLAGMISTTKLVDVNENEGLTVPGSSASRGADTLNRAFPASNSGTPGQIVVFGAPGAMKVKATQDVITKAIKDIKTLPSMGMVGDPFAEPSTVSPDGSTALINIRYTVNINDIKPAMYTHLQAVMAPVKAVPDLQVAYSGAPATEAAGAGQDMSQGLGLFAALIILSITFMTVLAMVAPLLSAVAGLMLGLMSITVFSSVTPITSIAPVLASMIGLGVGIDYAVFIVNRHREQLRAGMTIEESIPAALGTAGRAVLVAGVTVAIALTGLFLSGIQTVAMLGVTASFAVLTAILAALTLLPAVLSLFGMCILRKRDRNAPPVGSASEISSGMWGGWARIVGAHPIPFLLIAVVVLGVLTIPFFSMTLGQVDAGSDPRGSTTRIAYDQIAKAYGPGQNGPIEVVLSPYSDQAGAKKIIAAISKDSDVQFAYPPVINAKQKVMLIQVVPKSSPTAQDTEDLVNRIPGQIQSLVGKNVTVDVTGVTPAMIALSNRVTDRLPYFIGAVILLSFLLLVVEFRSILVPLSGAVMNVLSVGAAYGVIVAVFEWGWASRYIGVPEAVQIEAYVPMMMFAILFGLSMDYQVFLISTVREEHLRGASTLRSVEVGLSHTARVITAAALIMITVFLAFVLIDNVIIKMFGIGLATAVLIDATVVRLMLVPSVLVLIGDKNWWLPGWLDRILPGAKSPV